MAWDFALVQLAKMGFRMIPLKRNVQSRLEDYLVEVRGLRHERTPRIAALTDGVSPEKRAFVDYDLALWQFEDTLERLKLRLETGETQPAEAARELSRFRPLLAMRHRDLRQFKSAPWWSNPETTLA